ncbi:uncharacterized protein HKW66_Vig0061720 [Vigna angularis]|uniref:C2H2-type domain-containing protein n=1 Tax=Phaseolus angularis TaxID=3914 RepID=A0A8T0LA65_PHAAN|nr:uncharacterized protein HKW66_Vig0061720 [Vigna angularis]
MHFLTAPLPSLLAPLLTSSFPTSFYFSCSTGWVLRFAFHRLENKGDIKSNEPYRCRVCGRKFYTNDKHVNHFKQLHGNRKYKKVKLVAKYSMKMEKYKKAASAILTPRVGYGLADELKRAGGSNCEARLRCLKTIVVGDIDDGVLKRTVKQLKDYMTMREIKDKVYESGSLEFEMGKTEREVCLYDMYVKEACYCHQCALINVTFCL